VASRAAFFIQITLRDRARVLAYVPRPRWRAPRPWSEAAHPHRRRPLYRQIYEHIRTAITTGQLRPGDRVPSTRSLAERFGTARGTIDAAYAILTKLDIDLPKIIPKPQPRRKGATERLYAGVPIPSHY